MITSSAGHNQTVSAGLTSSGTIALGSSDQFVPFGGTAVGTLLTDGAQLALDPAVLEPQAAFASVNQANISPNDTANGEFLAAALNVATGAGAAAESATGAVLATGATNASFDEIDRAVNGDAVHNLYGFNGAGITVGIISDSFNAVSGDFTKAVQDGLVDPNAIDAQDDSSLTSDEGLAMAEIVHEIAPDAHIIFYSGEDLNSGPQSTLQVDQSLANAVTQLVNDGCNIICNDLFNITEPFYQPGFPSDVAITNAVNSNVAFFELADNAAPGFYASQNDSSATSYGFTYHLTINYNGPTSGDTYLAYNFGTAAHETPFEMVKASQEVIQSAIQWEQPWQSISGATDTQYGINYLVFSDVNGQPGSLIGWGQGDGSADAINFGLRLFGGTYFMAVVLTSSPGTGTGPNGSNSFGNPLVNLNTIPNGEGLWKVIMNTNGGTGVSFLTAAGNADPHADIGSGTLWGDEEDPNAITVGAVDYIKTPAFTGSDSTIANESFSAAGPGKYFFNENGSLITSAGITLGKVNISAPDGGNTDVNDFAAGGDNFTASGAGSQGGFKGTSAATPAAAAVGALLLQEDPDLTPATIETILEETAIHFGTAVRAGAGLVNALAAIQFAMTPKWAAAVSGDFAVAANWNPATVPDPNNYAEINASGTYTVSSTQNESVKSLTTASGATLDITAGTFTIASGTVAGANAGTIDVDAGAALFLGGNVSNSGKIEALAGVIVDSGTITGTGALTVGSGGSAFITSGGTDTGIMVDSGGTGIILSGATEFSAKISGGVLQDLGNASHTTIVTGTQNVFFGGRAVGTTINTGFQQVFSASTATGTTISLGGEQLVYSSGTVAGTTIKSGGFDVVSAGGTDLGALISGSQFDFGLASGATVLTGTQVVEAGGVATRTVVKAGGTLDVEPGGLAVSTTISSGGLEVIFGGGTASGTVSAGGTFEWIGSNQNTSRTSFLGGATIEVGSDYTFSGTVSKGVTEKVLSGGTDSGGLILPGGVVDILSGGVATGVTVSSGGKAIVSSGGADSGIFINRGGTEFVSFGGTDIGATVSSGGELIVFSRGTDIGATIASGGTEIISSGGSAIVTSSIASGGMLETASGGTAIVSGAVSNSGALIASGPRSLVEIVSGAVVGGGAVKIGNGIVDVLSGGTANVNFLSTGSGGLEIADVNANSTTFTGDVLGFGGVNHTNHKQFIDLVSVTSAAHTISFSYTSASGSGTLTVSSGGAVVASIELIGAYTSGDFHVASGISGTVAITDPGVVNGGSVEPAEPFPRHGIDLPNIAFGAQMTLAYSENAADTAGTLTVSDGRHAAAIALLGNYMAGSFVTTADGRDGTVLAQGAQTGQQPLLTHPVP